MISVILRSVVVDHNDLLAVIIAASGADCVRECVLAAVFAFYDRGSGSLPHAFASFVSSGA